MNDQDIFLKFCLLNRNFNEIIKNLKSFGKIWKDKFIEEFSSNQDIQNGIIKNQSLKDKFLKKFYDLQT